MYKKSISISVIICTHNRCESLRDTLDSLLQQERDDDSNYEVIVVDNNSTDSTRRITMSYIAAYEGRLRYIIEPAQGLSNARNTGVANTRGKIVVFTDDDCVIDRCWLKSIKETFSRYDADCVFGKILPIWESRKLPRWLMSDKRLWGRLALLDYGDDVKMVELEKEQFFGANFALKKETLLNVGPFDPSLGRNGKKLFSGEDTVIFKKLLLTNKKIVYNPLAIVHHKIERLRTKKSYFRKWHFFFGQSYAHNLNLKGKKLFGIPAWLIRKSVENYLSWLKYIMLINQKEAFRYQLKCITTIGMCTTCFKKWLTNAKN